MVRKFKNPTRRNSFKTPTRGKNKKIILLVVLTLILGFFALMVFLKFLTVKKVRLEQSSSCLSLDQAKSMLSKNTSILFIKSDKITADFQKKFPCLADLKISLSLPDTLILQARERTPVLIVEKLFFPETLDQGEKLSKTIDASFSATLEATKEATLIKTLDFEVKESSSSGLLVVDDNGYAFLDDPKDLNLPKIAGFFPELELGKKIDSRIVRNSLEIFEKLKDIQIEVVSGKVTKGIYLLILANYQKEVGSPKNLKLIFSLTGNHLSELASLQLILQRNKIDLKSIESIDLRFDKPIVVYMNGKR